MTVTRLEKNWEALEAFRRGQPIQVRFAGVWQDYAGCDPQFDSYDWRPKPKPPPPLEYWMIIHKDQTGKCGSREKSEKYLEDYNGPNRQNYRIVHMREVLDGEPKLTPGSRTLYPGLVE
jgi:hypothetical protein